MIALFTATIFLSAALLFAVQPMFGRLVLPLLGGAPAVWNTCLVFFQALLLAGYGYAHLLSTYVRPARQVWVHGVVLLVALFSLPIAIPAGWTPPVDRNPVPWLLAAATMAVGLPFFVVSATSPLLQRWFATTDHPAAGDPYFLYAASNLGSLIALVGYPVLIEPRLGLGQQGWCWTVGYGGLGVLIAFCADTLLRRLAPSSTADPTRASRDDDVSVALTWRRRLRWVLLAVVPSSLLLSVTNYISMDLAAIPLLWVVPLALYLGTFSLAFARRQLVSAAGLTRFFRLMLVLVATTLAMRATAPLPVLIPLHLLGLFAVGLVCHRELAADRPPPRHLTEFYLWLSLGGVLGGAFNALVAPVLFRSVLEYPIGLLLACVLVPGISRADMDRRDWLWPAYLLVGSVLLVWGVNEVPALAATGIGPRLVIAVPALVCYSFVRRPLRYALGLLVLLVAGSLQEQSGGRLLRAERTFFGIHRVVASVGYHRLSHGTTVHGLQSLDPARQREPLNYYTRSGPLGQALAGRHPPAAVVGLGAGAVAAYAGAGERWTFYEIDPAVERLARDPQLFTYIQDCPATVEVVLGDARLTLRDAPNGHYRMIILDAYNSDAIPLHLITREALRVYLQKLRPDGVLVWHMTNRHMHLDPVVAALARDAGLVCLIQHDAHVTPEESAVGKAPSKWAVMARDAAHLGALTTDKRWQPARERPGVGVWTDDYANVFSVLNWPR